MVPAIAAAATTMPITTFLMLEEPPSTSNMTYLHAQMMYPKVEERNVNRG